MKKQLISAILLISLSLSLCACGSSTDSAPVTGGDGIGIDPASVEISPPLSEAEQKLKDEQEAFEAGVALLEEGNYEDALLTFYEIESYAKVAEKVQEALEKMAEDESTPAAASSTADEPVFTVFEKESSLGVDDPAYFLIRVPAFATKYYDTDRLNTEIYAFYMKYIRNDLRELERTGDYSRGISFPYAGYEYHVNGNIISLLCEIQDYVGGRYCLAINTDPEGRELSREDVLSAAGMDEERFLARAREVIAAEFFDTLTDIPEGLLQEAEETRAKTLSEENLLDTQIFLSEEGRLSIYVRVYSMAGAGAYMHIVDL